MRLIQGNGDYFFWDRNDGWYSVVCFQGKSVSIATAWMLGGSPCIARVKKWEAD